MGMKGKIALGAVVGVVVIGVASTHGGNGSSDGGSGSGKDSSASAHHSSGGSKAAATKKKAAFAGDGDFRVGSDIKPGTYRTTGNSDGMCYWERAKDAKGEMNSIIANDNVSGTSYVTVKATDRYFKSNGCKDWEAVDTKAKGTPATGMAGDGGMFRVGADIAPGTYRSTGNSDGTCYWERAKDAGHSLGSIIANNNATGTAVVTISSSDAYFKTTGCQDWKKTG
ncbi:hypothetical protein LXH13_24170 [Streptomyces spinosirectus]|jgi:hypothetical protein|uniref:hypothetical protein n=1 Tax=Streptomyces TaxID=1883 RepID=UPI000FFF3D0D|nr:MULTISPECIES: hypothetical protein [Streptomyces]MBY8344855.1 hypothetical protein [Streptomyces plumbidurans]UIR19947.1 hypothetical protein LXH13_24170 [Streptomyces spinosirectus]